MTFPTRAFSNSVSINTYGQLAHLVAQAAWALKTVLIWIGTIPCGPEPTP